jgi:hypothetical protein
MDRPSNTTSPERDLASLADADDLRSVISTALAADPVDEQSRRRRDGSIIAR